MQAEITSWYDGARIGDQGLVVFPKATNVGSTTTAWNTVAFVGKNSAGRVVACGQRRVYGPTNAEVPGYGITNVLRPGESGYPLNGAPWFGRWVPGADVASVSAWPLWKE